MPAKRKAKLQVLLPEPIEPALARVRAALQAEGFGVLTDIDVQETLRAKLGTDFYPYRLLGACNPDFAYRALEQDPALGVFLPCTVAVYDTGAGTEVHIQDPAIVLGSKPTPEFASLVQSVRGSLEQVIAALQPAPVAEAQTV
jgi:uncharacterized protein (DUF302 family)